ncbi:amino acid ABC transporter substrate-binding protein, partial [Marinomonas sp. 42_23_T18]
MKSNVGKLISTAAVALTVTAGVNAGTLDDIKAKGFIQCGVSQGVPGFSNADDAGNWTGIDVDGCRAAAAAVFGDAQKVKFTPLSSKERFAALSSGEIDMLSRNTTWTYTRDTALGLDFTAVNFYDGQGFMVRKDLGVTTAMDLDGATVCTEQGTTTELNMADFFRKYELEYVPVVVQKVDEAVAAYASGRCDVYTTDKSGLAAQRTKLSNPDDHMILPETISKEPLGPVVRHGDNQWKDVVTWAIFAQVNAEEMGITSKNVAKIKAETKDPGILRLLGAEGNMGANLGLTADWAYNIIAQVGNYEEVFERNIGPNTPVGL